MDRPIEAVTRTKCCLCNHCEFAGEETIPETVSFDFESYCGIAERGHDGHFRSALVPPKIILLGEGQEPDLMRCRYYQAFINAKKEIAA